MQTSDPALNAAYWEQVRELSDLRETVATRDARISELEAALAVKREAEALPDIRVCPPVRDEEVHQLLQSLWLKTGTMGRFGFPEKADACEDAINELAERLLGPDREGFWSYT